MSEHDAVKPAEVVELLVPPDAHPSLIQPIRCGAMSVCCVLLLWLNVKFACSLLAAEAGKTLEVRRASINL